MIGDGIPKDRMEESKRRAKSLLGPCILRQADAFNRTSDRVSGIWLGITENNLITQKSQVPNPTYPDPPNLEDLKPCIC